MIPDPYSPSTCVTFTLNKSMLFTIDDSKDLGQLFFSYFEVLTLNKKTGIICIEISITIFSWNHIIDTYHNTLRYNMMQ